MSTEPDPEITPTRELCQTWEGVRAAYAPQSLSFGSVEVLNRC